MYLATILANYVLEGAHLPVSYSCICNLLKQLVLTGASFAYGVPSVLYFAYDKIPLFLSLDVWEPNQVRIPGKNTSRTCWIF